MNNEEYIKHLTAKFAAAKSGGWMSKDPVAEAQALKDRGMSWDPLTVNPLDNRNFFLNPYNLLGSLASGGATHTLSTGKPTFSITSSLAQGVGQEASDLLTALALGGGLGEGAWQAFRGFRGLNPRSPLSIERSLRTQMARPGVSASGFNFDGHLGRGNLSQAVIDGMKFPALRQQAQLGRMSSPGAVGGVTPLSTADDAVEALRAGRNVRVDPAPFQPSTGWFSWLRNRARRGLGYVTNSNNPKYYSTANPNIQNLGARRAMTMLGLVPPLASWAYQRFFNPLAANGDIRQFGGVNIDPATGLPITDPANTNR